MNKQSIDFLKEVLSGIIAGSQQHFVHSMINRQKGYVKLADRMFEESKEEMDGAGKFINRILELGGTPEIKAEEWPILMDVEEQLRLELSEQEAALEALNSIINSIENDMVTKLLFEEYLMDETRHTQWLKNQVNLIEEIGLKNFLTKQI